MPTTYIGDPTQTRSPALKPGPGGVPSLALPNDGEAANAASIAQALKVLADYAGFTLSPKAKPSEWGEAVQRWRSAQGHTRFAVDHLGFPAGAYQGFDELWPNSPPSRDNTGSVAIVGSSMSWSLSIRSATDGVPKAVLLFPDATINPLWRGLYLYVGDASGDFTGISCTPLALCTDDLHAVAETRLYLQAPGAASYSFSLVGNPVGPVIYPVGSDGPTDDYIAIKRPPGGGNWRAVSRGSGGSEVLTDTGVAASAATVYRMRIEWHGANVSDDAAASARFYINGSLVATHASPGLGPTAAVAPGAQFFTAAAGVATAGSTFIVGPIRHRANTLPDDSL